jgi:hypothetical protein
MEADLVGMSHEEFARRTAENACWLFRQRDCTMISSCAEQLFRKRS